MSQLLQSQVYESLTRLFSAAETHAGELLVIGGSTSAVLGEEIGKAGDAATARIILSAVYPLVAKHGLYLAVQGCEHVNRVLVTSAQAAQAFSLEEVNVLPTTVAGGALASVYYQDLSDAVTVSSLRQRATFGLDIGGVLIGMHLRPVVVPLHLGGLKIGKAQVSGGYTRLAKIGGERTSYR